MRNIIKNVVFTICVFCILKGSEGRKNVVPDFFIHVQPKDRADCVQKTGVSIDVLEGAISHGFVTQDPALSCFFKCIFEKYDLFEEDDRINYEKIVELFPDDVKHIYEATIVSCKNTRGKDRCDTAFLANKCYFDKDPDVSNSIIYIESNIH